MELFTTVLPSIITGVLIFVFNDWINALYISKRKSISVKMYSEWFFIHHILYTDTLDARIFITDKNQNLNLFKKKVAPSFDYIICVPTMQFFVSPVFYVSCFWFFKWKILLEITIKAKFLNIWGPVLNQVLLYVNLETQLKKYFNTTYCQKKQA